MADSPAHIARGCRLQAVAEFRQASRQALKNLGRKHEICNSLDESSARERSQVRTRKIRRKMTRLSNKKISPGSVQISITCKW